MLWFLISLAIAFVAATVGFSAARNFVRSRLRFVDAVQNPVMPVVAGVGAWLVALPLTLLPIIGAGTAITFGIAVAAGVATGAREIRRSLPPGS